MPLRPRSPRAVLLLLVAVALPLATACERRSPGETLYRKHCADCHGLDAAGNTPRYMGNSWADLLDDSWRGDGDEYSVQSVIREGVFGAMPANTTLTDEEVRLIVDWLFYLRGEER